MWKESKNYLSKVKKITIFVRNFCVNKGGQKVDKDTFPQSSTLIVWNPVDKHLNYQQLFNNFSQMNSQLIH